MKTVYIKIDNCLKCPNSKQERFYTGDSFEHCFSVFCKLKESKEAITVIDWHERQVNVPSWCPLSTEKS